MPEDQATGQLIKFGESQTILDRIKKSHVRDFNGFKLLDVVSTLNPVVVEKRFKQILDVQMQPTITAMSHAAPSQKSVYPVYSSVLMQAEAPEAGHHISHAGRAEVQHLL